MMPGTTNNGGCINRFRWTLLSGAIVLLLAGGVALTQDLNAGLSDKISKARNIIQKEMEEIGRAHV